MSPTAQCVQPWIAEITTAAKRHGISPLTVAALVATESSGLKYAQRVELGFARRYVIGIAALVKRTLFRGDDKWSQYPEIFCSSVGLCQVMIPTAIEYGFEFVYPGELFEPATNLDIGCRILARHLARNGGDLNTALLRYNGGSDLGYPGRVLSNLREIREAGLFDG